MGMTTGVAISIIAAVSMMTGVAISIIAAVSMTTGVAISIIAAVSMTTDRGTMAGGVITGQRATRTVCANRGRTENPLTLMRPSCLERKARRGGAQTSFAASIALHSYYALVQ